MSIKNLKETDIPEFISRLKEINTGQNKKACVITLGCQQNEADSEKIRAMARDMGYEITDDPFISDLIVVNTCAVRRHAELKALSIVGNFKPYKKQKPDLIVGICGCMAAEPHMAETVKKSFAHVSFTLEPSMLYRLPELVFRAYDKNKRSFVCGCDEGDLIEGIDCDRVSKHRAWVSIMDAIISALTVSFLTCAVESAAETVGKLSRSVNLLLRRDIRKLLCLVKTLILIKPIYLLPSF